MDNEVVTIKEGDVIPHELGFYDTVGKRVSDLTTIIERLLFSVHFSPNCVFCGTRYNELTRSYTEKHQGIDGRIYTRVKRTDVFRICTKCGHIHQ
jgi:hypothetical protein